MHHEQLRSPEPDVPEHQEEPVADRPHVPEEKRRLHKPVHKTLIRQSNSPYVNKKMNSPAHVAPVEVIVEAVAVDEAPGAPAAEHRPPPPLVVLHRQLEVRQRDGDERGDDDQDDEDDEQDAVNRVHLVAPHAGEDVVELDVYSGEGQSLVSPHFSDIFCFLLRYNWYSI